MAEFADQPATTAGGIGGRVSDSDWMCTDVACGNINFARRTICNRCNKERADLKFMSKKKLTTEIGKSAADKSRGLFSADDWQCNKCANVNWARRQTCNVCAAPKFGEVEARTGYGGGYNERGTVEYRPRRDSDEDEYDEFGRRKKRKGRDRDRDRAPAPPPDKVGAFGDIGRKRSLSESSNMPTDAPARMTLDWCRSLAKADSRPETNPDSDPGEDGRQPCHPKPPPLARSDLRSNVKTATHTDAIPDTLNDPGVRVVSAFRPVPHPNWKAKAAVRSHAKPEQRAVPELDILVHSGGRRDKEAGRDLNLDTIHKVDIEDGRKRLSPVGRSRGRLNGVYIEPRQPFFRIEPSEMTACPRSKNETRNHTTSGRGLVGNKRILSGHGSADSSVPFPSINRSARPIALRNRDHVGLRNPSFERGQYIALEKNPRHREDCIMENRVSSTNEVRYRFEGGTVDENFQVTYSLEERVWAASCAVIYHSCKISSEMFQSKYDKPAPDFKTIFAWRQRLLTTGCLLDSHLPKEQVPPRDSGPEPISKRWRLRKKRFYMHKNETSDTSEDERFRVGSRPKKMLRKTGNEVADRFVSIDPPKSDVIDKNVASEEKYGSVLDDIDNSSSYRSGGSRPARNSRTDNSKSADRLLTDGTRSVTPELTAIRMDLARFDLPVGPASSAVNFHDDICFESHIPVKTPEMRREPEKPARFAVPEVPKLITKTGCSSNNFNDSLAKGYFEDIVSESELNSSDGAQSENDSMFGQSNDVSERNHNSDDKSPATVSPAPVSVDVSNDVPPKIYNKADTVKEVIDIDYYSPSKVIHNIGVDDDCNKRVTSNILNEEQSGTKKFSSAMRRIYERMSESNEESGEMKSVLEYVPTKINPAMAKRNHHLFNSDGGTAENINGIWPDNGVNEGSAANDNSTDKPMIVEEKVQKTDESKSNNVTSFFADYLPDEDALYRDTSNDMFPDHLKTPPESHSVKSISTQNSVQETKQQDEQNHASAVADGINALVNFNFATVNAEQLALALKNIQNMLVSKEILEKKISDAEKNKQVISAESNNTESQQTSEPANKSNNIPFLDDMFYPGSPVAPSKETENPAVDADNLLPEKSVGSSADINLDNLLECPTQAKKVSLSGFQSFAIPKPVMLSRLKSLSRLKEASNDDSKKTDVKKKKKNTRTKSNEEDRNESGMAEEEDEEEESGDDEDLSKYDLCGSEDENDDQQKKSDKDANVESSSADSRKVSEKNDNQRRDKSKSPPRNQGGDRPRKRSQSRSSSSRRSSSSSSSSSVSSSDKQPKNRYDDFNLNSEASRAGSRENSPNTRSRSPIYPPAIDANRSRNTGDKRRTSRSRSRSRDNNKTKSRISSQDSITRDKGRNRDRDNRDRIKGGRDSRDNRRPHHNQNQNHSQNSRYHHHPRGRGRGGVQMRRMW